MRLTSVDQSVIVPLRNSERETRVRLKRHSESNAGFTTHPFFPKVFICLYLAVASGAPARLVGLCEMETLEALNRGWANHERVISSTLQEERANVKLRIEDDSD